VLNLPNLLSFGRLLLTIPLVVLILINTPTAYAVATALFFVGSVTDTLDGRLARKLRIVSNMGVFLDLTADKIFVAAGLIALVQVGLVPAWIAIVIVTREFLVSGLRALSAAQGVIIPAGRWGKQKTFLTLLGLGGILLARGLNGRTAFPLGLGSATHAPAALGDYLLATADTLLLLAVVWTVLSAYEYLRHAWGLLAHSEP
jgi:CDP-diacylglycerol--glycerol-3-phosphate 3-phosphatidyltransferase